MDKLVRCPPPGDGHKLEGCGSSNVAGPDNEGLYDCLNCGLWFDKSYVRSPIKQARGD